MIINILAILSLFTIDNMPQVVKVFHQMNSQKKETDFIQSYAHSTNPSVKAYVLSTAMKQAEYTSNPWKKLNIFNTNKAKLELLIKEYPENIHLRYVRLVIQEKVPAILAYSSAISDDKAFLQKKLDETDSSDYLDYYIKRNTSL